MKIFTDRTTHAYMLLVDESVPQDPLLALKKIEDDLVETLDKLKGEALEDAAIQFASNAQHIRDQYVQNIRFPCFAFKRAKIEAINQRIQILGDPGFQKLPEEMVLNIFLYLSPKRLCVAARVCKKWQRIAYDQRKNLLDMYTLKSANLFLRMNQLFHMMEGMHSLLRFKLPPGVVVYRRRTLFSSSINIEATFINFRNYVSQALKEQKAPHIVNDIFVESCWKGLYSAVAMLIYLGLSPNQRNRKDKYPLIQAASAGQIHVVKFLIANKANVNQMDNSGWCPLTVTLKKCKRATEDQTIEMIKLLIASKVSRNVQIDLMPLPAYAVHKELYKIEKLLLDNHYYT